MSVYLDNSATTAICDAALDKMNEVCRNVWGNPSSVHGMGVLASRELAAARKTLLSALGGRFGAGEIIFCSSGTEADNLAIFGVARAKKRLQGGRIIITDSEHPAISNAVDILAAEGFDIVRISTRGGVIDIDELVSFVNDKTLLVSIMSVNNETGARYDIKSAFSAVKRKNPETVTHTYAVQAFLKTPEQLLLCGADMVSISSHKIHGPKGIGALYISSPILKAKKIVPVTYGGGQECGMRSGTENLPGIAGFAAAAEEGIANLADSLESMKKCREYFESKLDSVPELSGFKINRCKGDFVPHIISLSLLGVRSEVLLRHLSGEEIYVSSGSACSSKAKTPSKTLLNFGLDTKTADSTIRISLSRYTTIDDMDRLCDALASGAARLARTK